MISDMIIEEEEDVSESRQDGEGGINPQITEYLH